jgi:hypothetical protein
LTFLKSELPEGLTISQNNYLPVSEERVLSKAINHLEKDSYIDE